jgi:hypothetical protein
MTLLLNSFFFNPPGAFVPIATTTVSSTGVSNVAFNNVPGNYQHLQARVSVRGTSATSFAWGFLRINHPTTTSFTSHYLQGTGTTTDAFAYVNSGAPLSFLYPQANATANVYGAIVCDILDYAVTTKNKVARFSWGGDSNGSGHVGLSSLLLTSTSAVTKIEFISWESPEFAVGSTFALYGIKSS